MNLLIIDDEIEMIHGILSGVCWSNLLFQNIFKATGVTEAKQVMERESVDVVLCDIEMPDGFGLDLVEWIREHYVDVECLILTCHEEFEYARRAISLGCCDYILKPIIYRELEVKLAEISRRIQANKVNVKYQTFGREWMKHIGQEEETGQKKLSRKEMVEQVKAYVRTHLQEDLKTEVLAGIIFITPDYLFRIFKKEEGITLLDFIVQERMFLASELLKENRLTISRIAYECGYDNYSYFSQVFKKKFGVTPREFQKESWK